MPPLAAVEFDEAAVHLRLTSPHPDAPPPWQVGADGARWMRTIDATPASRGGGVPSGLTAVGLHGRRRTLVDLTESGTLVALVGAQKDRLEVAHRWIDERSQAPWSRGLPVMLVDLPELATDATRPCSGSQLNSMVVAGGEGIAFLRDAPGGAAHDDLATALRAPGCRWAVVVLGAARARWIFVARPDGAVTCEAFPARPVDDSVLAGLVPGRSA